LIDFHKKSSVQFASFDCELASLRQVKELVDPPHFIWSFVGRSAGSALVRLKSRLSPPSIRCINIFSGIIAPLLLLCLARELAESKEELRHTEDKLAGREEDLRRIEEKVTEKREDLRLIKEKLTRKKGDLRRIEQKLTEKREDLTQIEEYLGRTIRNLTEIEELRHEEECLLESEEDGEHAERQPSAQIAPRPYQSRHHSRRKSLVSCLVPAAVGRSIAKIMH
jgi:septal ring factor EnvC (AmiA/AmiB activator)